MTPLEAQVVEAVEVDWLLALLADLVAIPSLAGAETPAQERVAAALREIGMEVDLWPIDIDTLSRHPAFCVEVERAEALGCVGSLGGGDGPTLILNGHVDVVPAGDPALWTYPPWEATLANGRVYGRGALDMKAGLCCAIAAARALAVTGVTPCGLLLVQSVVGEEDGGLGTLAAIERGYTGDGAIVVEPTELNLITASAGALSFRLAVPGQAAHGCVRDAGVSAVELFELVHRALRDFEAARNAEVTDPRFAGYRLAIPLSIGTVKAGDWPSTVPELLVAEGRYGIAVGAAPEAARADFEAAVAAAAELHPWLREHPPEVAWWGGQFAPASTDVDSPVATALSQAVAELGGEAPEVAGVPYGSDMRLLVNQGHTPTVLYGPGDVRLAHAPDEYVPVEEIEACARALALMAVRFCGG